MNKVSIKSQRLAVEQFIQRNCIIFTGAKGELHREHMRAVATTLRWLEQNEHAIRELVAQKDRRP
ncbi:hypothetical protein P7F60_28805 [Rhizobium sp. YJ-22]|uniref:hypothetical protein n=1 Tax=Rhizobium sp. YJ-22 TaxID=3037556 RepID=UPI0024121EA0|nr:hypothetical protein [Rhizobium sp. YJ-22]MDG3580383.1 hypothetical protein [Rhizobium sp. YJ-22]